MRRNYTVHLALAAALVLLAAFVGQVRRWEWGKHSDGPRVSVRVETPPSDEMGGGDAVDSFGPEKGYDHEALVRFKPGVSEERIQAIAARLHDRVEDEIESVNGLVAVEEFQLVTQLATLTVLTDQSSTYHEVSSLRSPSRVRVSVGKLTLVMNWM